MRMQANGAAPPWPYDCAAACPDIAPGSDYTCAQQVQPSGNPVPTVVQLHAQHRVARSAHACFWSFSRDQNGCYSCSCPLARASAARGSCRMDRKPAPGVGVVHKMHAFSSWWCAIQLQRVFYGHHMTLTLNRLCRGYCLATCSRCGCAPSTCVYLGADIPDIPAKSTALPALLPWLARIEQYAHRRLADLEHGLVCDTACFIGPACECAGATAPPTTPAPSLLRRCRRWCQH